MANTNRVKATVSKNTQSQVIGITSPVPMGDWQTTTPYLKLNIVRYNGASYIAKKQSMGVEPTVTTGWQEVWQVIVYDGSVIPNGTYPELTVGKATEAENDGTGNNIAEQFETIADKIETLSTDFINEEHFKGVFQSEEALKSAYPTATPNDYAYIAGGNMWIYEEDGGWTDSETPTPDSIVPASKDIPQMDSVGNAGDSNDYSRGNHVHPSDTSKVNKSGDEMTGTLAMPKIKVDKIARNEADYIYVEPKVTFHSGTTFDGAATFNDYIVVESVHGLVDMQPIKFTGNISVPGIDTNNLRASTDIKSPIATIKYLEINTLNTNGETDPYPSSCLTPDGIHAISVQAPLLLKSRSYVEEAINFGYSSINNSDVAATFHGYWTTERDTIFEINYSKLVLDNSYITNGDGDAKIEMGSDHVRLTSHSAYAELTSSCFYVNTDIRANGGVYDNNVRVYSPINPPPTGSTPSDALPLMDGTASAGTSSFYSRSDHKHPSDTTKADIDGTYLEMTAGKLGTATKGSSTLPIYLNAGTPTACSRTIPAITLNGASNTAPSFFAPTTSGTSGYVLKSNGSGAPTWSNIASTYSTGTTGYIKFLNGFIVAWGQDTGTTIGRVIYYPIVFTNIPSVIANMNYTAKTSYGYDYCYEISMTGFKVVADTVTNWIAVGF